MGIRRACSYSEVWCIKPKFTFCRVLSKGVYSLVKRFMGIHIYLTISHKELQIITLDKLPVYKNIRR